MAYSRPVEMPRTKKEGLANFVQLIINKIESGDTSNALLGAVDLLEDLRCGIYDDAMADAKGHDRIMGELVSTHQAEIIKAAEMAYQRGVADEKARMAKALGLVAA